MRRFVEGVDRGQTTLFPECLEDWIDEDNPVRVIDAFVEKLDLSRLGSVFVFHDGTGAVILDRLGRRETAGGHLGVDSSVYFPGGD